MTTYLGAPHWKPDGSREWFDRSPMYYSGWDSSASFLKPVM